MTPKRERFVAEYLIDLNATQAAIRAGYSRRNAEAIGCRLLKNVKVSQAVAEGRANLNKHAEMDAQEWRQEVARVARADLRKLVDPETGTLIPINELSDDAAAALAAVEVKRERTRIAGEGETVEESTVKVKLWDKVRALELMGRHLGLLRDQVDVNVKMDIADRLIAARKRLTDGQD